MADLVAQARLVDGRHAVSSTDDGGALPGGGLGQQLGDLDSPHRELGHLEHHHRPVPNDGIGGGNLGGEGVQTGCVDRWKETANTPGSRNAGLVSPGTDRSDQSTICLLEAVRAGTLPSAPGRHHASFVS